MADSDKLKISVEQEFIIEHHSRMVGKVLDLLEASMPEGTQVEKLKKLVQVPMCDFRHQMLQIQNAGVKGTEKV